ncbi:MAG TPA: helical backbone metal receptor [Longimicrobiales bacterium]|nr:helical backbone metal receptor [Longimicrobiales bacterium]
MAGILAAVLAGLSACSPPDRSHSPADSTAAATAIRVVDDIGRAVVLAAPARRVISLIPAQTEVILRLAGPDVLVARTRWDTDSALASLPSVGNALTPSVEWLAALRPDLVIAWPDAQSRDVVKRLDDVGIPVYASRVESVADVRTMIRRLGVLLGRTSAADSLDGAISAELESVRRLVAGRPERSVLYLLNAEPPMAAGPGTYVDELIRMAGGRNVFDDLRQLWPQVALEEIIARQPDVIIRPSDRALDDPLAGLAGRPGWRELDAVRHGRVHAVDPDLYNRPGPRVGAAAHGLAQRIHAGGLPAGRDAASHDATARGVPGRGGLPPAGSGR